MRTRSTSPDGWLCLYDVELPVEEDVRVTWGAGRAGGALGERSTDRIVPRTAAGAKADRDEQREAIHLCA